MAAQKANQDAHFALISACQRGDTSKFVEIATSLKLCHHQQKSTSPHSPKALCPLLLASVENQTQLIAVMMQSEFVWVALGATPRVTTRLSSSTAHSITPSAPETVLVDTECRERLIKILASTAYCGHTNALHLIARSLFSLHTIATTKTIPTTKTTPTKEATNQHSHKHDSEPNKQTNSKINDTSILLLHELFAEAHELFMRFYPTEQGQPCDQLLALYTRLTNPLVSESAFVRFDHALSVPAAIASQSDDAIHTHLSDAMTSLRVLLMARQSRLGACSAAQSVPGDVAVFVLAHLVDWWPPTWSLQPAAFQSQSSETSWGSK